MELPFSPIYYEPLWDRLKVSTLRETQPSRLASAELEQAARHAAQAQLLSVRASRRFGGETVRGTKLRRLWRVTSELVELIEWLDDRQQPRPLPAIEPTAVPLLPFRG